MNRIKFLYCSELLLRYVESFGEVLNKVQFTHVQRRNLEQVESTDTSSTGKAARKITKIL